MKQADPDSAIFALRQWNASTAQIARELGISGSRASVLIRRVEERAEREQRSIEAHAVTPGIDLPIEHAGFSTRAFNMLRSEKYKTLGDVADAFPFLQLCRFPNLGKASVRQIEETLKRYDIATPRMPLSGAALRSLSYAGFDKISDVLEAFASGYPYKARDGRFSTSKITPETLKEIVDAVRDHRTPSRVFSGSPYEKTIGFSRAVRSGDRILVSGTAPVQDNGTTIPGDVAAQAERVFAIIVRAVEDLGGSVADVVRTRIYLVDNKDADAVGAAHARFFGDSYPAATMAVVAGLLRPEWRVEAEAEAVIGAMA